MSIETIATSSTAPFAVRGRAAIRPITRKTGGELASTYPAISIIDICSVNGIKVQKPEPQASTRRIGDARIVGSTTSAATSTTSVAARANTKGSGIHRSVHALARCANRSNRPARSASGTGEGSLVDT